MKKILLFTILCQLVATTKAQPYFFWQSSETYTPLVGGTSVNGTTVWNGFDVFTVPIGFTFNFMDAAFTSFDFEATGRVIFDVDHYYFADMLVVNGLQDKGAGTSLSPITYQLTGSPGTQIFKLEISNATFSGDLTATVDFQIWIYEELSRIELHSGPVTIPNEAGAFSGTGPSSGVFHVTSWTPETYAYGLMAYDDPLAPEDTIFSGPGINTFDIYIDGWPAEDEMYIYSDSSAFMDLEKQENTALRIWPNPAGEFLIVDGLSDDCVMEMYDLSGALTLRTTPGTDGQVDLRELTRGVYLLRVVLEGACVTEIFVRE